MNSYLDAWRKSFWLAGRSRRRDFWYFKGIDSAITIALLMISAGKPPLSYIFSFYVLVSIVPAWTVTIRRFHDIDRSGWWMLMPFYNIYCLFVAGTRGPNRFGRDPTSRSETNASPPVIEAI